jgi:valyl-tRNA synthetase
MPQYNHQETEKKWQKFWEKEKIYKFDEKSKKPFVIDTPPPTVSGEMHIGHAFSYSQQDFIARFQRMKLGKGNVFYPFGTDDNGLPTERLIEKLKGIKSKNMPRAEFIKICVQTLKEITPKFVQDWKDVGISCDFDACYSTIDSNSRKISQKAFIELFKKGEVYTKEFPTIWCPECQTSIAQAELEDKEMPSNFLTLKFKVEGKELLIATTRPELLGACVAVFVHPDDKKYKSLVGKKAKIPLFEQEVPIIGDKSADPEKGTGAMMVCSYGDKYDVEAVNRYRLKPKIIFNKDGTLNFGDYKSLKIKEARKKIIQDLREKNLIKEEKQISHVVNVHDKCGTEIEFLPTEQWFIKILDKKKIWIEQGKKIKWHPKFMFKRYENWVNGLEWDWNISRERHFGVPIPVWKCKDCDEIILANEKELPIDPLQIKKSCPKCKKEAEPETKVLDTWATSSLTPQIISSLTKNKVKIPYSLRPQAHEIIRTWAFYTIVRSYLHGKKLPWENIMVSGFVTLKGEKMSKSKGNVIAPKEVLNNFGADALRFAAASTKLGEDADYQEKDLVAGKRFVTKLLNASNFVFMNLKDFDGKKPKKMEKDDIIFLGKMNEINRRITDSFNNYEYLRAKQEIDNFFWNDFCSFYLESVKKVIYENKEGKKSAQHTLYKVLLTILKLISPIMPFITEEIYQNHFKKFEKDKSIHVSEWPKIGEEKYAKELDKIEESLYKVHQLKSSEHLPLNAPVYLELPHEEYKIIKPYEERFLAVSGAVVLKSGKEFKIEKSKFPKAGTEPNL